MKYITPLNTKRQQSFNTEPSMTKQEFKDDCDPTLILKKYQATGLLEHANQYEPVFGTQSSMTYHEARQATAKAEHQFAELPSSTRKLFDNNVGAYLDWVSDPENVAEIQSGGKISLTNQKEIKAKALEIKKSTEETEGLPDVPQGESIPEDTK